MPRQDWLDVARSAAPDDLREQILTGFKAGKPFTPYVPTLSLPARLDRVLDFGCGVGRNFPYLRTLAHSVAGFDLPPMIERCRTLATESADLLSADWQTVRIQRFDLIFAALVLQHVEYNQSCAYIADFARMTPLVYVLTRAQSDFEHNVIDLIASMNLFDIKESVEVEHDDRTHQLRVIGPATAANARRAGDMRHYELLLRSVA